MVSEALGIALQAFNDAWDARNDPGAAPVSDADPPARTAVGDPTQYFVVAMFARWVEEGPYLRPVPSSMLHAKEMGTLATACGLPCETWPKWFERPFPTGGDPVCRTCEAIASADGHSDAVAPPRGPSAPACNRKEEQ